MEQDIYKNMRRKRYNKRELHEKYNSDEKMELDGFGKIDCEKHGTRYMK